MDGESKTERIDQIAVRHGFLPGNSERPGQIRDGPKEHAAIYGRHRCIPYTHRYQRFDGKSSNTGFVH